MNKNWKTDLTGAISEALIKAGIPVYEGHTLDIVGDAVERFCVARFTPKPQQPDPATAESTATCSHQWRDTEFEKQLVKNFDIAPSEMKPERTYRCIRCKETIEPAQQPEPSEVCETCGHPKCNHEFADVLDESDIGRCFNGCGCRQFKPATPPASEPSREWKDAVYDLANEFYLSPFESDIRPRNIPEWMAYFHIAQFAGQRAKIAALKIALADAIRCPMGVCPDSAVGLLTVEELKDAENRRIEGKSPAIKHIGLTGDQNEQ